MIISHKHRFIFIKTRKTAGTSIEAFLARHIGPEDVLTPIEPPVAGHTRQNDLGLWWPGQELADAAIHRDWASLQRSVGHLRTRRRFYKHMPARLVRARIPASVWSNYYIFCVERNPFDKTLSHFHMLKSQGKISSFEDYLAAGNLCLNVQLYTDINGKVIVDRVLPFENLNVAFGEVMKRLGIPYEGVIDVRAKAEYRKNRADYRDVISPGKRAQLERAFAGELELHGYRF